MRSLSALLLGSLLVSACATGRTEKNVSAAFPYTSRFETVDGVRMHYVEEGQGDPILLLHGNPTSSYLWRNIIPHLSPHGRVIALDLVGMGRSDKPRIEYSVHDHAEFVGKFIEQMELRDVTLVLHDWGSVGFDYAAQHPDNVKGVAFMEALVGPLSWKDASLLQRMMFERLRDEDKGKAMIIERNFFVEKFLPYGTIRRLSEEEMNAYRAPFIEPTSRKPMVVFPQELPIDGEPADVHAMVNRYARWLQTSSTPKLLLYAKPGMLIGPRDAVALSETIPMLEAVPIGRGRHYVQEDQPTRVGRALARWYTSLR